MTFVAGEGAPELDGYIEPSKPPEELRQDPYPLPKDFVWATLDLNDDAQVQWPPLQLPVALLRSF